MRALVVAHGEPPSPELLAELAARADIVIAADGGAELALDAGLDLTAVVGDLDSLSDRARAMVPPARLHAVPAADRTDLQKAIEFAIAQGCNEVDVVSAGGGRADHALANLSVVPLFRGAARVRLIDDLFEVELVEREVSFDAPVGTVVSLVSVGRSTGVTTKGLRWNLADFTLDFSPLGVHNEVVEPPVRITVASGDLLLFRGRWIEKHA